MAKKNIILEENTRILYNRARSRLLKEMPKIKRLTDDLAINIIIKKYLGCIK